jgi:ATP-binding cassette subfamily B protein
MNFKVYRQHDQMDCGPTCLRMIAKHHGRNFKIQTLRQLTEINKEGVSLLGISDAAEKIGFRTLGAKVTLTQLAEVELPCILHWQQNHFVVLYRVKNQSYFVADPAKGLIRYTQKEFTKQWISDKDSSEGIALLLSPTPVFLEQEEETGTEVKWSFLLRYLTSYRQLVVQLLFGLGIGSLLQLIVPFLTQSVVDIGINTRNLSFIYIIVIAQGKR